MHVNPTFPSFKELREILISAQKDMENRIVQINYAPGLRTVVEQECNLLKLSCKVVPFSILRSHSSNIKNDPPKSLWGAFVKKITSFLIGLNSKAGVALLVADLAKTTTSFYLKKSEISLLKGEVGIHTKKRKKYRTIRNIIIVPDLSELTQNDLEYITFLASLIREKYITRTLLVVFQNQDYFLLRLPDNQYVYSLNLTADMIQNYLKSTKPVDDGIVQIINLIGIQYLEAIYKIIAYNEGEENEQSIEKLIALLLGKLSEHVPIKKTEIDNFLKICSLLFDRFCLVDIENTFPFREPKYRKLLAQCIEGKLLRAFIPEAPLEYAFVENFVREYYRKNPTIVFSPQIYIKIFNYLKKTYPQNYTDIALLSGFIGFSKHEILSYYIIAYYHDKFTIAQHKKQKIVSYLQLDTIGERLIWLENCNGHITDMPRKTILGECYNLLDEILIQEITLQSKLCALNTIATLVYELEDADTNRLKVMDAYRELLTEAQIFSKPKTSYFEYIADAVLFSTCIDNDYRSTAIAQRLINQLNFDILAENTPIKSLRLFRLGNALYPTDIPKGLEFTRKAYVLSKDLVVEHELARINYGASLIICGEYVAAAELFRKADFSYSSINFSTELSVENNRLIAEYFSVSRPRKRAFYLGFKKLFERVRDKESSDINIIKNNYVSACLTTNQLKNVEQLEQLCKEIENMGDTYHIFFAEQNRLILYYLMNDKVKFSKVHRKLKVPNLMRIYENFLKIKLIFYIIISANFRR